MTKVAWKSGTLMTVISSLDEPGSFSGSWSLCFYVPKGTKTLGLYADRSGTLLDATGNVALAFSGKKPGFHAVEVPQGRDGTVWRFQRSTGVKRLVTVPPCLAANPGELLLPREVDPAKPPAWAPPGAVVSQVEPGWARPREATRTPETA